LRNEDSLISENATQTAVLRFGTLVPFIPQGIQKQKLLKMNALRASAGDSESHRNAGTNHPN
jgi:hypothetical protein